MTDGLTDQQRAANATEFLALSAAEIAAAKADMDKAGHMLRVTKALVMQMHESKPVSAQERDAYASEEYLEAVNTLFDATRDYEHLRAKREAAKMRIEFWRSLNASHRQAERGYGSAA